MIKIVVDAMGGDNSPSVNVSGAVKALNEIKNLNITLVGDESQIVPLLAKEKYDKTRLEVLHASEVISCNDKPTEAIKQKRQFDEPSFRTFKTDSDARALVSLGSTGALLAEPYCAHGKGS